MTFEDKIVAAMKALGIDDYHSLDSITDHMNVNRTELYMALDGMFGTHKLCWKFQFVENFGLTVQYKVEV